MHSVGYYKELSPRGLKKWKYENGMKDSSEELDNKTKVSLEEVEQIKWKL